MRRARTPGRARRAAALLVALPLVLTAACSTSPQPSAAPGGAGTTTPSGTTGSGAAGRPVRADKADLPWPMHPIDSRFKGANSLGPGDVNGDGLTDYVTNYEFDQRYVVALHPPAGTDPRRPWPTVTAFVPEPLADETDGINTENAALGDVDGDGNTDVIGAQGISFVLFWEGSDPGVRVVWGPGPDKAADASAWTDGGKIPSSVPLGHVHWVTTRDVNADGALDIVVGGRLGEEEPTPSKAGIAWYEAPKDRAARRDLARWTRHAIAPDEWGGHGFVFGDVDQDGDDDIALANADFDTPADQEAVLWYENPGPTTPQVAEPWTEHVVYRGDEFHTKPQVKIADVDGDGRTDLAVQTPEDVYWFRKTAEPATFERVVIPKDPRARFLARTFDVVDIDGNGTKDFVGMLTHVDGEIPTDKAAVFWMAYTGDHPTADNWTTHVIKYGAGDVASYGEFGEKYDMSDVRDVDGDGDLDIVANIEEWWEDAGTPTAYFAPHAPAVHAVVWFENTLADPPTTHEEGAGTVSIEAEHPRSMLDGTFTERATYPDASGGAYIQSSKQLAETPGTRDASKGWVYGFDVGGGTYTLWARRWVPSVWGKDLGGTASDDVLVDIDDRPVAVEEDPGTPTSDTWTWIRLGTAELTAGPHDLTVRQSDGGVAIDKLVLTTGTAPQGSGPEETPAS